MRAGLSVAVAAAALIARKRESLHRKAEEERVCAYSCRKTWPRIIQVNSENVNNYSRARSLHSTVLKDLQDQNFANFLKICVPYMKIVNIVYFLSTLT